MAIEHIQVLSWYDQLLNQALCVGSIFCVDFGLDLVLNSELSRHYVLDILLRCISGISWFDILINQTLCVRYFTLWIMGTLGHRTVI